MEVLKTRSEKTTKLFWNSSFLHVTFPQLHRKGCQVPEVGIITN